MDLVAFAKGQMKVICSLSDNEVANLLSANQKLISVRNHVDFFEAVLYLERQLEDVVDKEPPITIELNIAINNYLAGWRMCIDHWESYLSTFSDNGNAKKHFEQLCHDAYDKNYQYQICYNLRNYVIHNGMLLPYHNEIAIKSPNPRGVIRVSKQRLLEWDKWKTSERNFLLKCPDILDLYPLLLKAGEILAELNKDMIVYLINDEVKQAAVFAMRYAVKLPKGFGAMMIADMTGFKQAMMRGVKPADRVIMGYSDYAEIPLGVINLISLLDNSLFGGKKIAIPIN